MGNDESKPAKAQGSVRGSKGQTVIADASPQPVRQESKKSKRSSLIQSSEVTGFPSKPKSEPVLSEQQLRDLIAHLERHMDSLEAHMRLLETTKATYETEYQSIPNPTDVTTIASQEHSNLNRYKNIMAYDQTRVKVTPNNTNLRSDYVNANYIRGYESARDYIASQGPVPDGFTGFWQMIWESNVDVIVRLTNEIEGGKLKAHRYWPMRVGDEDVYGSLRISLTSERTHLAYIKRSFTLYDVDKQEKRDIFHFCYTAWPDHGVPETTEEILLFREVVRMSGYEKGNIVVHCSAGVGRTGTYISIDRLIRQALDVSNKSELSVVQVVTELRSCRNMMVQTLDQYKFVFEAVLDGLSLCAYRMKKALNRLKMTQNEIKEDQIRILQDQVSAFTEPVPVKPLVRVTSKQPVRPHSTQAHSGNIPSFNPYTRAALTKPVPVGPSLKRQDSKVTVEERKAADPLLGEAAGHIARRQSLQAAFIENITHVADRNLSELGYDVGGAGIERRVQSLQQVVDESFNAAYLKAAANWSNQEDYAAQQSTPLLSRVQSLQEQWELRGANFRKQIEEEQLNDLASLENRLASLLETVKNHSNVPKAVDPQSVTEVITVTASDRLQSAVDRAANWSKDDNFGREVEKTAATPVYLGVAKPEQPKPAPVKLSIKKKETIVPLSGPRPSTATAPVKVETPPPVKAPTPEPVAPAEPTVIEEVPVNRFAPLKSVKKAEAVHPMIANAGKLAQSSVHQ